MRTTCNDLECFLPFIPFLRLPGDPTMKKRGFAFVEVLVIVGLIVIGMALLLPAIQQSRQDARRTQCKNNLKQYGLALHNYHDVYNKFPPGWISKEGGPGHGARIGWQTSILPFVDQAPMFNQIDFNRPPHDADGKPIKHFQTVMSAYRCPTDPAPNLNPLRGDYATSNYSGNYGDVPPPRLAPLGLGDFWPGAVDAPMTSRGIFARNSSVGMAQIIDGTSNTLMVGERGFASGAGIWVGVTDNAHEDDSLTDGSHRSRPNAGWSSYSSRHGGGVHFLLCDGSVRFINDEIDSKPLPEMGTLQKLACKSDGHPMGEF
jgi:prepilin-type processing-associated H-X9-DG protein